MIPYPTVVNDVPTSIPKSDLLGVTTAVIHLYTPGLLATYSHIQIQIILTIINL